jgi:Flp pilus assembly protein TadD
MVAIVRVLGGIVLAELVLRYAVCGLAETSPAASPAPPEAQALQTKEDSAGPLIAGFDVTQIAADARGAVAFIAVQDKTGKTVKTGTGFFVAADGKLITNAHVLEDAATAEAKLENGAAYNIVGVLKAAVDKDLVVAKVEAKGLPFLRCSAAPLPAPGMRIIVVGSPLGLEGTVSDGIVSGQRIARRDDEWLQITAAISPGSSGSPVLDSKGDVVAVATFVIAKAQSLNFARPVRYVSELLNQITSTSEVVPLWTITKDPKQVVLNDPEFIKAEEALEKNDAAGALKRLNKLQSKYSEDQSFLLKLGLVYDRLHLLDDAVQAYQHALKIDPTDGIGWTNLALTYVKLGKFPDAKDAADQAVKQSPDFGPAWGVLGYCYQQAGRFSDAADALQKAAKLTPNDPSVWRNLSETYAHLNDRAKSDEAGAKLVELAPPSPSVAPSISRPIISTSGVNLAEAVVVAPASKGLNVRAAPDSSSPIVVNLRPQDHVYLNAGTIRNNAPPVPVTWQRVTTKAGANGWLNADYLAAVDGSTLPATPPPDQEVWQLFEKWLAVNTVNPAEEATLYADPAESLDLGTISRQQIEEALRADLQKWPQQSNRLIKGPFVEKLTGSEWRITFQFNFDVRAPIRGKRVTGVADLTWIVRTRSGGGVEITSAKEQVLKRVLQTANKR